VIRRVAKMTGTWMTGKSGSDASAFSCHQFSCPGFPLNSCALNLADRLCDLTRLDLPGDHFTSESGAKDTRSTVASRLPGVESGKGLLGEIAQQLSMHNDCYIY
jgi:hypothetical protein